MVLIIQKDKDQKGILRANAMEVPLSDIGSAKIKKVIADMKMAIRKEDDAVAIAAPQIGVPVRIFIISDRVFKHLGKEDAKNMAFINPVITKLSRKKVVSDEGCLSVRPLYGLVERAEKATVRAYDENGVQFTYGASNLLAQIFQHEADHLDGVLFTDKASKTWEHIPEKESAHGKKAE